MLLLLLLLVVVLVFLLLRPREWWWWFTVFVAGSTPPPYTEKLLVVIAVVIEVLSCSGLEGKGDLIIFLQGAVCGGYLSLLFLDISLSPFSLVSLFSETLSRCSFFILSPTHIHIHIITHK